MSRLGNLMDLAVEAARVGGRRAQSVDLPPGADPRYLGVAPDRSGGAFARYEPPRGTTPRMERLSRAALDPQSPLSSVFDRYIEKGTTLGGPDWYNTEELRDWFIDYLGPERGDAEWRDYLAKIGATSGGAKVPANIRIASFYRALGDEDAARVAEGVKAGMGTPQDVAAALGIRVPNLPEDPAYGHQKQRLHAGTMLRQLGGDWDTRTPEGMTGAARSSWLKDNPKVRGFFNSLLGNRENIAADIHFMRMLGMAEGGVDFLGQQAKLNRSEVDQIRAMYGDAIEPYINTRDYKGGKKTVEVNLYKAGQDGVIQDTTPFANMSNAWANTPAANEYAAYEQLAQQVAQRYDMTPAQFQAALWMGAGDLTGLADESQGTFMELFRRALDKRAGERGISRSEMLEDFITNRAPLMVPLGAAAGGGGLLAAPSEAQADPLQAETERYMRGLLSAGGQR